MTNLKTIWGHNDVGAGQNMAFSANMAKANLLENMGDALVFLKTFDHTAGLAWA